MSSFTTNSLFQNTIIIFFFFGLAFLSAIWKAKKIVKLIYRGNLLKKKIKQLILSKYSRLEIKR